MPSHHTLNHRPQPNYLNLDINLAITQRTLLLYPEVQKPLVGIAMDFLDIESLLLHLEDHVPHQLVFREQVFEDCMAGERMAMMSKAGLMEFASATQRLDFGVCEMQWVTDGPWEIRLSVRIGGMDVTEGSIVELLTLAIFRLCRVKWYHSPSIGYPAR